MIVKDFATINSRHEEMSKRLDENAQDQKEYLRAVFDQLLQPSSGPVVTKTPKVARKRLQRIETIPEDDVLEQNNTTSDVAQAIEIKKDADSIAVGRTKRIASLKAVNNIAKQSLLMQGTKPRLPSNDNISSPAIKVSNSSVYSLHAISSINRNK